MEIDITKPLISRFTLEEKVWHVAYEGIHLVCFTCRRYGHKQEAYPSASMGGYFEEPSVEEGDKDQTNVLQGQAEQIHHGRTTIVGYRGHSPYGPWMLAQHREKRPPRRPVDQGRTTDVGSSKGKSESGNREVPVSGSRYAPLDNDDAPVNIYDEGGDHSGRATGFEHRQTSRSARKGGNTKRANVIANEK